VGFERVYLLYSPATYETADVLQTYVYRRGLVNFDIGYATAVGMINSIVASFLVITANTVLRKMGSESTLW
jgi:putative aldouronate transport system permease protein